jgi:hypothetical protein
MLVTCELSGAVNRQFHKECSVIWYNDHSDDDDDYNNVSQYMMYAFIMPYPSSWNMEATYSSEILVIFCQTTL